MLPKSTVDVLVNVTCWSVQSVEVLATVNEATGIEPFTVKFWVRVEIQPLADVAVSVTGYTAAFVYLCDGFFNVDVLELAVAALASPKFHK